MIWVKLCALCETGLVNFFSFRALTNGSDSTYKYLVFLKPNNQNKRKNLSNIQGELKKTH